MLHLITTSKTQWNNKQEFDQFEFKLNLDLVMF